MLDVNKKLAVLFLNQKWNYFLSRLCIHGLKGEGQMWENEDFTVIFCQHLLDSLQTFFRKKLPRSWVPAQDKAQELIAFYEAMHFSLSLWWLSGKESACQCKRQGFDLWIRKIPWRRKWQPAPVFLPGECNGQRTLAGYSP